MKVGLEALRGVKTINELSQEFGVHPVAEYFAFYNGERPHQSLGNETPDVVYRTAMDDGALSVDKFPRAAEGISVDYSGTDGSTAAARSRATPTATYNVTGKPGQRRPAASEVECAA